MMKKLWDRFWQLDEEKSIWIEESDLGYEVPIQHKSRRYYIKMPRINENKFTLRLAKLGKQRGKDHGNLYLHVWLNKGAEARQHLWISDREAQDGAEKKLALSHRKITMLIPPKSHQGLTFRLRGLGAETQVEKDAPPLLDKKRGDLLVELRVYPEHITPQYGSFNNLSTEDMHLEGWAYKTIDEILRNIGKHTFPTHPLTACVVADTFNEQGWQGIFHTLVEHLQLSRLDIRLNPSHEIPNPGSCEKKTIRLENGSTQTYYQITIQDIYIDRPFFVAAILAHELCHVVYFEYVHDRIDPYGLPQKQQAEMVTEMEHTVDLLVFMYKLGEFQLRIDRESGLKFGYFHQELFERFQTIVEKKLKPA
jgi:hypothetical protein